MPFYIRKSVSAGPFRFNLSKSGIGLSVGVKGFRVGTGPRGHYVHAGRGGLYYRASIGGASRAQTSASIRHPAPPPNVPPGSAPVHVDEPEIAMVDVQSGDVGAMRDATVAELVDDLNLKQARIRLSTLATCCVGLIGAFTVLQSSSGGQPTPAAAGAAALATLLGWATGRWIDSYRRSSVLFYYLEEAADAAYRKVIEAFDALGACYGRWHIASGGAVQSLTTWKRNAGASHVVNRKAAHLVYILPKVLRSNVTPPAITLGKRTFYFFPEIMLIEHGGRFGAIGYDDVTITCQQSRFIETGKPPADAQIVDRTWRYPNKSGGPDRRFRDNRQLPVCLYDVMHLSSSSGMNELMEFSRTGLVLTFSRALDDLPRRQTAGGGMARLGSPFANGRCNATAPDDSAGRSRYWTALAGAIIIVSTTAVLITYTRKEAPSTQPVTEGFSPAVLTVPTLYEINKRMPPTGAVEPALQQVQTITVRTTANLRNGPSMSAAIIRVAERGEKFSVFGRTGGWVQVGTDRPQGWISASLLSE